MRKIFYSMLFMAVAALTMVSCEKPAPENDQNENQQQEQTDPETKSGIVLIASNPEVEPETKTQLGPDGFTAQWSISEVLHCVTNYEAYDAGYITRFDFIGTNTAPVEKAAFAINNAQASSFDDFYAADFFFAYHGDGFQRLLEDQNTIEAKLGSSQTPKSGQFDPERDILLSKTVTIDANRDYEANPVELQFKRLTGLVKINFKVAGPEHNGINGLPVNKFSMTTNNPADDFAGLFTVSLDNGEIVKGKGTGVNTTQFTGSKIGVENTSMFISVLPTTVKAGKKMTIEVLAGTKTLTKEVILEKDVTIPAGTITTLNLLFTDPDVEVAPDPGTDKIKVTGNTIDMTDGIGTLKESHVRDAMNNQPHPGDVTIKGSMNAADFNSLLKALKAATISVNLNLTDAVVAADPEAFYIDYAGVKKTMRSNEIPDYFFFGCNLKSVKLPKTLTSLGMHVFQNIKTLLDVTIESATMNIGSGLFNGCTNMQQLTFMVDWTITTDGELNAAFFADGDDTYTATTSVNLYILYTWDVNQWNVFGDQAADRDLGTWWGYTWSQIQFLDENGGMIF